MNNIDKHCMANERRVRFCSCAFPPRQWDKHESSITLIKRKIKLRYRMSSPAVGDSTVSKIRHQHLPAASVSFTTVSFTT